MRRLFWMGVGAAGAVVVAQRLRRTVARFTPEGVAEQVEEAGARTTTALRGAVGEFRAARAERERDLVTALLVTPEGGEYVRRRDRDPDGGHRDPDGRHRGPDGGDRDPDDREDRNGRARPTGRVDPDEPLYDF